MVETSRMSLLNCRSGKVLEMPAIQYLLFKIEGDTFCYDK